MSFSFRAFERLAVLGAALAFPMVLRSQPPPAMPVAAVGGEYSITRGLMGDQIKPVASFTSSGGFVAWQDNNIDGDGFGIAAVKLDQSLSPVGAPFRVNVTGAGDQTSPQIAALANGGAAIAWQGGANAGARVYARFLQPNGTFTTTSDVVVNTNLTVTSITPVVAALADGSVIVAWASYGADDASETDPQLAAMLGIYAQRFDSLGNPLGAQILVNQTVIFNQRNPAIAALADGSYAVAWTTELITGFGTGEAVIQGINVMYRKFAVSGAPSGNEIQANDHLNICASPAIAPTPDSGFTLVWVERDADVTANGLDIYARIVAPGGYPTADSFLVNSYTFGDQFAPQITTSGGSQLVVWSSLGQEGNREGVYGCFITAGAVSSPEFRVNTSTVTAKQDPSIAATPAGGFLLLWDAYSPGGYGYEIYAQRQQNSWPILPPPTVTALGANQFLVSWNPLLGLGNAVYDLYMDANPVVKTTVTNWYSPNTLVAGSLHTFRLGYRINGVISPTISSPVTAVTPSAPVTTAQIGVVTQTEAGSQLELTWSAIPGASYQLEYLSGRSWARLGPPRRAPGKTDRVLVKQKLGTFQYRVIKL
jgi:hypothetical protein